MWKRRQNLWRELKGLLTDKKAFQLSTRWATEENTHTKSVCISLLKSGHNNAWGWSEHFWKARLKKARTLCVYCLVHDPLKYVILFCWVFPVCNQRLKVGLDDLGVLFNLNDSMISNSLLVLVTPLASFEKRMRAVLTDRKDLVL